jgi:hypothetical protein
MDEEGSDPSSFISCSNLSNSLIRFAIPATAAAASPFFYNFSHKD